MEITVKTYHAKGIRELGIDALAIDKEHRLALHLKSEPSYDDGDDYSNDFIDLREANFILFDPTSKQSEHDPFRADSGTVDPEDNPAGAPTSSGKFYLAGDLYDSRSKGQMNSLKGVKISLETRPINYDDDLDEPMINADSPALTYFLPLLKAILTSRKYVKMLYQLRS